MTAAVFGAGIPSQRLHNRQVLAARDQMIRDRDAVIDALNIHLREAEYLLRHSICDHANLDERKREWRLRELLRRGGAP